MLIHTQTLTPESISALASSHTEQIYNGLDCCLTFEINEALKPQLGNSNVIYDFERALQAPVMDMMQRGFRVDDIERRESITTTKKILAQLDSVLQQFAYAVWDKPLNPRSTQQLQAFFYGHMKMPEQWTSAKGKRSLSMNREALEKLEIYFLAMPIVACILAIRDYSKQLQVFETEIDPDGRYRTSFNIAGTETGRFSSSKSQTGTGGNAQNISPGQRRMFESDPGYRLYGIDLEQAESREVGWKCGVLFDEWGYYDAALVGDLHTVACRLVWPKLPWTGDMKKDKAIAERPFYRHFTYRDMAKRGGHGSNYFGKPFTMARHLHVPKSFMESFQSAYFEAFPGIPKWHRWVATQLQTTHCLTTNFGRTRYFFGRPNDDTTLREAIAFEPQSCTADRTNLILWRLWRYMPEIQLLTQEHDAIYFQAPEELDPDDIAARALAHFDIDFSHPSGRKLIVPGEVKVGWNKANYVGIAEIEWARTNGQPIPRANPNGLRKLRGPDSRTRLFGLSRPL